MLLKDKVILITGASSGIGKELALQLADENCNLVLLARRENYLTELSKELKNKKTDVFISRCDVTNGENVKSSVQSALSYFGKIDIAILNAGANIKTNKSDAATVKEIFNVNVIGLAHFFEVLIPYFKEQGGIFIGVSSLADGRGFPGSGSYCASKAAASLFLESKRIELKYHNIKVVTVKPGFVKTPMTDKNDFKMPFLMSTEKACKIIISGIKKEKTIIQFPWPTVLGAKLLRIIPNSLFDFLAAKQRNIKNKF